MFIRTLAAVLSLSLLSVACGGDEPECKGTELSVPGRKGDPCPQTDAACLAAGGKAYASCENGNWGLSCQCIVMTPGTPAPPTAAGPAVCGDGAITSPTEKCDQANLNGETCMSLGFAGGGMLLCGTSTCNYDTSMCRSTMGNGAGTSGGAGMGGISGTGG